MTLLPLIFIIAFVQQSPEPPPEVRASLMLGARTAHVQRALPILNQVVVVPDEATYLDELSRWSLKGRWPVLFEREPFASQFIRTFSPEKVLRRTSIRKGVFDDIGSAMQRSEEHTSELQSRRNLVCRLLLEKKNNPNLPRYLPHLLLLH